MNALSRWLVALGVVAAAVGFTFLGVGMSFVRPESGDITVGWVLMVGGSLVGLIGWVLFRRTEGPDTYRDPGFPDSNFAEERLAAPGEVRDPS